MKKLIIVLTVALVVVSLLPLSSLAASTATVDYSLTRVSPILGEAVVTDTPMEDVYTLDWYGFYKPYMSFEIDKFINYFPPSFGSGYTMSLYFDDADFEGASGFKFYIVNLTASETAHYVRVDVADTVVSVVENMFDDFGVYFNEVTVYGENLDISDINIIIDCYVGELNSEENYRGVSFPVSKLSVTYDATTSQGIFLESINENTTAIYNNLTNAPESFTQAVEDAQAKLEEEKQLQEEIQNGFDNMPLPDADDFDDAEIVFEDMTLDFATFGDIEDLNGVTMREVWETIWDWGVVKYVLLCLGALLITSKLAFG